MVGLIALVYLLGVAVYLTGSLYLFLSLRAHERRWWQLPRAIPYAAIWFCLYVPSYFTASRECGRRDS